MKWLYTVLLILSIPVKSYSQIFNLNYRYTEVCSEEIRQVNIPIDLKSNNTLAFFGYSRTFTPLEIQNNEPVKWLDEIFKKWSEYYPCAEIKELVAESAKSASEKGDVDISQPIVIMSADLGYRNGGVVSTSGGYNVTDLKTTESRGLLITAGTDYIGNIGYYRIQPTKSKRSILINSNLLLLQTSVIGNLTAGILGDLNKFGSYFGLHTVTFGRLNGYPFQDNTIMLGHTKKILNTRRLLFSTNLIFSYTYRVKVFTADYWFEDYVGIKPFLNTGFKVTPTFGLNLTYTTSIRTDKNTADRWGLLLGGRVLF